LRRPLRRAAFRCPLCRDAGRAVTLVAEFDTTSPVVIVADLQGCAHADTFGEVDALTLDQTWALIDAALTAFERRVRRGRP
jgi:hypothetical protein